MYQNSPKISVIIITYNQEKLISRAIDSVLVQKEFVYEVVICDDCSTDSNWQVILEYKSKYPDIIKPHRNNENLGIFKNIESTWQKPTGDLILYLAGDDVIMPGLFKKVFELIEKENIQYDQGCFSIFTDSIRITPNGRKVSRPNHLISKGHNPISLKIRGLIGSQRGVLHSIALIKKLKPVEKDIGLLTDGLYDIQFHIHSEKNYYIDFVGGAYYSGIGVTANAKRIDGIKSSLQLYNEFLNILNNLDKKDIMYLKYQVNAEEFKLNPSFMKYYQTIKLYIKSVKFQYGILNKSEVKTMSKMLIHLFTTNY